MQITFGKHCGSHVAYVPTQYLAWVLRECDNIDPALRAAIAAELDARRGRRQRQADAQRKQLTHPGVAAWRSAWPIIVRLCHPDCGGNGELMQVMNSINEAMNSKERA